MNLQTAFRVFVFVFDLLGPFLVLFFVLRAFHYLRKAHKSNLEALRDIGKSIDHLYLLCDILNSGLVVPPAQNFYGKAREAGPGCDINKLSRDTSLESFENTRKHMISLLDTVEDPVKKEKLKKTIDELEGMFNLYSTLDENSSEEYKEQVGKNLHQSIQRIVSGDFDEGEN